MYRYSLVLLLFFAAFTSLSAQQMDFPTDSICLIAGGEVINVIIDDLPPGIEYFVEAESTDCYKVDPQGNISVEATVPENCCGPQPRFFLSVFRRGPDGQNIFLGRQEVILEIKCPKPDCGLVDLDEIPQPDPSSNPDEPQNIPCISACENSTATYLFSENMALTYVWQATNGVVDELPGLPGQIQVSWGSLGATNLSVEIFDASGSLLTTRSYCVTLTEAPIADFSATGVACLEQDVFFTNTSTGAAASYDWDFGDGNTAQNVATTTVTHNYDTPGTYTVTLVATSNGGLNPDGSQACCCVDSVSYDIVIDPDPGPGIFWISTLCEGDVTKYWTDATGCTDILWEISANGTITSDPTLDTIMVTWGSGPSGTLELTVDGCDQDYCPTPSVAVVPIVSTTGTISGPTEVCGGETANYDLPKWITTEYTWSLPDGGSFNGPNTGHNVSITWPTTPGTYTIDVSYGSAFLAGLPGHEGDDCYGTATLEVTVLNNFSISAAPNPACIDGSTFFNAFTDGSPTVYNWSVIGYPSLDMSGVPNYTVDWFHPDIPGPGVYTIIAEVVNAADYCVDVRSISVVVKDAVDPVINGPLDYCVGEEVIYTILSPTPGYTYTWDVSPGDGSVMMGQGGPTVTIIFTGADATVSVFGQDSQAPGCISETILLNAEEIEFNDPLVVTGPPACTNSLADYTFGPAQHPDATYAWSIIPETAGSVINGADGTIATVQWNDDPGTVFVRVDISLCGNTIFDTLELELNAPIEPVITQMGDLCPGGSAMLFIDSTQFTTIDWDLGGNAGTIWAPNAGKITVFEEGSYVVNTIDVNGCPGVARIRVDDVPGPDIKITTDSVRQICVNSMPFPGNPILEADTDPGNTIEWFCGGVSQGPAAIGNTTFTHVWTTTPGSFVYFARVEDPVTGCTEDSDPLIIRQRICCGPPYISDPISQIHTFEATRQSPNCDLVDLEATFSQDSVVGHGFNWNFLGAQIISSGGTVGQDLMTIRLPGVGCYDINHSIDVWAFDYDTTFTTGPAGQLIIDEIIKVDSIRCGKTLTRTVCNPLFADFDKREECGEVEFTDLSQFDLPSPAPTITYSWDFGDGDGSSDVNPVHEYGANGTYTVTLTITDGDCVSTATMTFEVTDLPDSDFTVSPNPVCYGQPATFTGTGSNIIEWEWDFGDGATFNGNGPQHTFLPPFGVDDYDVTLITTNRAGCKDTVVKTIDIFPTPALDIIEASNGFIICDGESTVLSVDNIPGLTYEWSTNETTSSITVSTAGTYGVTITNADGCSEIIEPVEVQVIPLPDASWIGNPFICDDGSTKLTALAGGGHSFTWENQTTGVTVTGMMYNVPFSFGNTFQEILLTVTNDAFGCTSEVVITVEQAISPTPNAQITAGGPCEGDGSLIEVINPQPDVVYTWNTGEEGLSIFTYAAGTYTVVGTDVRTGCVGIDQVTIHPLPDICIVPTGCYESCAPDTLHAPLGDYSYAWYENGVLVGTGDFLIVDESASYSVTVIDNVTGCTSVSDSLYLEVIDCDKGDCDDITTRLRRSDEDTDIGDCCFELYYTGLPDGIHSIQISSTDANLPLVPGSSHPDFGWAVNNSPSSIQLAVDMAASAPIPSSLTVTPAATFCPVDPTSVPQEIIVDYLDVDGVIVCSDTLFTECPVEPDCVYIARDSIYCADDGTIIFDFTICNPSDADFSVGFVELIPGSPAAAAVLVSPANEFNVFPALAPGDCRTFTTSFPAMPAGATFAYSLIGHSSDPNIDPSALCCSDPASTRELIIPDCDPCDNVGVRRVRQDDEGCCYDIILFNDAPAPYAFDGIDLCLIGGDGTLNVYPSIGDPLVGTVGFGGQTVSVFTSDGTDIPNGNFTLPTICLEGSQNLINQIEIKWLSDGGVVCRDTIEVRCTPPCGYLEELSSFCEGDVYVWTGTITNTSPFVMSEAYIDFDDNLGLDAYNTTIVFGSPLSTGQSQNITIIIGSPAGPGDKISFTVTLHETGSDDHHLNCCQFEACIELPDCPIEECTCENEDEFQADVNMGFDTIGLPSVGPLTYRFDPRADFTGCDSIVWSVRRRNPNGPWMEIGSNQVQDYTFPERGRYQIWMRVYRFDDDGKLCTPRNAFRTLNFGPGFFTGGGTVDNNTGSAVFDIEVFPNPAEDEIQVVLPGNLNFGSKIKVNLYDFRGSMARAFSWDNAAPGGQQVFRIRVSDLPSGVYVLRGTDADGQRWNRRFVKQ